MFKKIASWFKSEPKVEQQREQVDLYVQNTTRNESFYKNLPYWKSQTPPPKGQKFIDPLFPPNEYSLKSKDSQGQYIDKIDGPENDDPSKFQDISWLRASEIYQDQQYLIFENKIEMADTNQGILGDCYFFAACSAMTEYPNLVYQIFKTKDINEEGYFELVFFIDGKYQIVIIDDYFPVFQGTRDIAFTKPNNNEIWVCILEKAWAKINGGYTNIIGGFPYQVLEVLTGFPSQNYIHGIIGKEEIWNIMVESNKKDYFLTCSTQEKGVQEGLLDSHAYSIINCHLIDSKGKKVKLIETRNTWGKKEWEGDWGDDSPLWGIQEKTQVKWEEKDNGVFFMSLDDYYKNFLLTNICNIQYSAYSKMYTISGDDIFNGNVFNLYFEKDGILNISLIRKNWRINRELHGTIIPTYLSIVKYEPQYGNIEKYFTEYEGRYESFENTTLTKELQKGYYLVYVYHDLPHSTVQQEDSYIVKFDSCVKFNHALMPSDKKTDGFPLLKKIIIQAVLYGKGGFMPGQEVMYSSYEPQFKNDGLGHLIVYNPKNEWICYKIDISEFKNEFLLSPYDEGKTEFEWYIPPKQFDCILGMRIDSKKQESFFPKNTLLENQKVSENKEVKINLQTYANDNVSNSTPAYDFLSASLKEAKCQLNFAKIDLCKKAKEDLAKDYPEIIKILDTIPSDYCENGLTWLMIPLEKVKYVGQANEKYLPEGRGAFLYDDVPKVFFGNLRETRLNGHGAIYNKNLIDKEYEGEFFDDKKHGKGIYNCPNGDKYEGNFRNDIIDGKGAYYFENGDKYEGEFNKGIFHGKGTLYSGVIGRYEGDFVDGNYEGKGVMDYSNGSEYQGGFVNNKKHGKGKYYFPDGTRYEGTFVEDRMEGKGTFYYKNGAKYEGDVVDGKQHGKGKLTISKIEKYEGDFVNDKKHGKGKYNNPNGDKYEGDFVEDRIEGKGKYTFANGDKYEGDFANGVFNGKGKFNSKSIGKYEGDFVNGLFHGKGILNYSNGNVYEGDFIENKKSGHGIFTFKGQGSWEGNFVDDLMDGTGTFTGKDKKKTSITYSKGNQVG